MVVVAVADATDILADVVVAVFEPPVIALRAIHHLDIHNCLKICPINRPSVIHKKKTL